MDHLSGMAIFTTLVESGSFTAAAKRLYISKSTVSKQLGKLEDRLGTRLLNRTTRKLSLTDTGRAYFMRCRSIVAQAEEASLQISRLQAAPRGRLKLAASMSFGISHLSASLADFMLRYPDLSVELTLNDRKTDIVAEGFDLAIRIGILEDSTLIARKLNDIKMVTIASPDYLKKHGMPRHPRDLEQHNGLCYSYAPNPHSWQYQDRDGTDLQIRPKSNFIGNNGEIATRLALAGVGICRLPLFICWQEISRGDLVPILRDFPHEPAAIYAVYPHNRHLSAKVRAFVDFMIMRLGGDNCYWDRVLD